MDDQQIEFLNDQGKELNDEGGLHLSVSEQIILLFSVNLWSLFIHFF